MTTSETVVLKVDMACQGCVGAVNRVLSKVEGVDSFDIDIDQQKVTVIGKVEPQVIFDKVSKTGKKTEFWKDEVAEAPTTITSTTIPTEAEAPSATTTEVVTPAA